MLFKRTLSSGKKCQIWTARYRSADGRLIQKSTGCKDKRAAQARLSEWLSLEEKRKAGIMTAQEADTVQWVHVAIHDHIEDFETDMKARNLHKETVRMRVYYLQTIFNACKMSRLSEINRARLERWLYGKRNEGMGARTANGYLAALVAFGGWLLKQGRISVNPFLGMTKFNEATDKRRPRRAFTQEELAALFEAAAARPLHEAMYCPVRTKVKGESKVPDKPHELEPQTIDNLQWLGRVRSMAYQTMSYTGLRFGECRSLTIGACHLESDTPYLELEAQNEKARRGAQLPVPAFFMEDMKRYLHDLRKRLIGDCSAFPGAFNDKPLFDLPAKMTKAFNADLVHAGLAVEVRDKNGHKHIDKKNDRGESVDIHCLRHSFVTHLAQSGVSMVTVAKAARHSDPKLTLKVYAHVNLAELGEAVSAMPQPQKQEAAQIVNTDPERVSPKVSPESYFSMLNSAIKCNISAKDGMIAEHVETPINKGLSGENDGGRYWTRTSGPLRVKQVL